MAVSDPDHVDTVARGPQGQVLLAMTEERSYVDGDTDVLTEDFRRKLNAYVHLIRSGQLRELVDGEIDHGVEIRLFCADEPPPTVLEMIELADRGLTAEGVSVGWILQAPATTEQLLGFVGQSLTAQAPPGWASIRLSATLVGDGLAGSAVALLPSGEQVPLQPAEDLVRSLGELKRTRWEPQQGTWVSFYALVEGTSIEPVFDFGEPDDGVAGFRAEDWAEELRRYPREDVPAWWPRG